MKTIGDLIGTSEGEEYLNFDLSEVQEVLTALQVETAVDLPQAENMQRMALRAADVLSDYLGNLVKVLGYLESKLNKVKNKALLEYEPKSGKATADMRKAASESSDEVEELAMAVTRAKSSKFSLEKKYDIIIKQHHFYKDIASGFKKTIVGNTTGGNNNVRGSEGWD